MWIGVLRPPIVRITISRPQLQPADVHRMHTSQLESCDSPLLWVSFDLEARLGI